MRHKIKLAMGRIAGGCHMNRDANLSLIYIASVAALLFMVALARTGHQDAWVLQDILVPTVAYILVFAIIVVRVDSNRNIAALSASFLLVLCTIPNLKYDLFSGNFDSVGHYGFVSRLLLSGHVPQTGFYSIPYGDFPGMQIVIGEVSLVMGIPVNGAIKLFTTVMLGIIPLMVYFVSNGIFDREVQRAILLASGLPCIAAPYLLGGGAFGVALLFCFLCVLLRRGYSTHNRLGYLSLLVLLGFAVLFSHPPTMIYLLVILGVMLLFLPLYGRATKRPVGDYGKNIWGIFLILSISFVAVQVLRAQFILEILAELVREIFLRESTRPAIPTTFFSLPLSAKFRVLAVMHTNDIQLAGLALLGFLIIFKRTRFRSSGIFDRFYLPLTCVLVLLVSIVVIQLVSGFGRFGYDRAVTYAMVFEAFLVGPLLWYLGGLRKPRMRPVLLSLLLFGIISLSLVQVFVYQPMIPPASELSKALPQDEYLFDFRQVNSIYNIRAIAFAESRSSSRARVTSDIVTRWQIYGFTSESFSSRHIYDSPLETTSSLEWDLFILHYAGEAGILNEKVEYRTRERIAMIKDTEGNTVYDNGASFIISGLP